MPRWRSIGSCARGTARTPRVMVTYYAAQILIAASVAA
jgi:hypothetical protein